MNKMKKYTENVLNEIEERFYSIPFDNSAYQNRVFVLAGQLTPARAYRAIGLRMFHKIRALREAKYDMQLQDIDVEENKYKINLGSTTIFDKQRLEIKNKKIIEARTYSEKLVQDAIKELDTLYAELQKYPRYDAESFENEEELHFQVSMERQLEAEGNGVVESLQNMHKDSPLLNKMLDDPKYLDTIIKETKEGIEQVHLEVLK